MHNNYHHNDNNQRQNPSLLRRKFPVLHRRRLLVRRNGRRRHGHRTGNSLKLGLNRVVNSSGQTGLDLETGVIDVRGTDDLLNIVVAGLDAGALNREAVAVAGKQSLKIFVPT